jgi:hypothetical protein
MATYNVNRAKHVALGAAAEDVVNFAYVGDTIRVRNRDATSGISFTLDGTAATVDGDDTYYCGPGESVIVETKFRTVRLISSGAPTYSVEVY